MIIGDTFLGSGLKPSSSESESSCFLFLELSSFDWVIEVLIIGSDLGSCEIWAGLFDVKIGFVFVSSLLA